MVNAIFAVFTKIAYVQSEARGVLFVEYFGNTLIFLFSYVNNLLFIPHMKLVNPLTFNIGSELNNTCRTVQATRSI